MKPEITKDGPVDPREIENLRVAVGWDRSVGTYDQLLPRRYAYYIARGDDNGLVGYVSVLSDGIADAFLLDLMVHPEHRQTGLGSRLVKTAVEDMKHTGVQCVQVTFDNHLEPFYAQCGFHIFGGGIIDFKHMGQGLKCQQPAGADGGNAAEQP
jgi:GNAT superfamily N-acetyltransferase